jgi:hypothetical protein
METFAIAARLHVVMRRALGRVTDVEWMTRSREYANEVIRLARLHADPELLDLADKLEASLAAQRVAEVAPRRVTPVAANQPALPKSIPAPAVHGLPSVPRYVGRLR